ncbi:hypothetical protein ABVT39_009912 [Epinephelus coioides]
MADGEKETPFSKLLDAIQEAKEDLTKHIDKKTADIQTTLTKIESSLSTLSEQVEEIETRFSAIPLFDELRQISVYEAEPCEDNKVLKFVIMSVSCRAEVDVRVTIPSCFSLDPEEQSQFYDSWAENYEQVSLKEPVSAQDQPLISYRGPHLAVDFLSENFSGSPEEARVLDVSCGTGWVAKLMVELGFRHIVGVDGSKNMLERAAKTALYQDLKLALLGPEPLPAHTDTFDVVITVSGLDAGYVPVSVVRELCLVAKPGNQLQISRCTILVPVL